MFSILYINIPNLTIFCWLHLKLFQYFGAELFLSLWKITSQECKSEYVVNSLNKNLMFFFQSMVLLIKWWVRTSLSRGILVLIVESLPSRSLTSSTYSEGRPPECTWSLSISFGKMLSKLTMWRCFGSTFVPCSSI